MISHVMNATVRDSKYLYRSAAKPYYYCRIAPTCMHFEVPGKCTVYCPLLYSKTSFNTKYHSILLGGVSSDAMHMDEDVLEYSSISTSKWYFVSSYMP